MYHFCTYFDKNYLIKGLALYKSLMRQRIELKFYVLCFDNETFKFLVSLNEDNIEPILLKDFEKENDFLLEVKKNRSQYEYYFTCTPSLPLYIMRKYPKVDIVTYLDADIYFFASPEFLYERFKGNSILIITHNFPEKLKKWEKFGKYNVSIIMFRNDSHGIDCLTWWREKCVEWCFDKVENGKYADQKYLDDWNERFSNVISLSYPCLVLAPWNLCNYSFQKVKDKLLVNGEAIVAYHFHNLNRKNYMLFETGLESYHNKLSYLQKKYIYAPYLHYIKLYDNKYLLPSYGSNRHASYTTKYISIRKFIYKNHLLVVGPFIFQIYLEPLFRPLFKVIRTFL